MQFSLLGGEFWFLALSVDLLQGLTNPFSSYSRNQRQYSVLIYLATTIAAVALVTQAGPLHCQGNFRTASGIDVCWISDQPGGNKDDGDDGILCFWIFYLGPCCLFYAISVGTCTYAYYRLSMGLDTTYATRRNVVSDTFRMVFAHLMYGLILLVLWAAIGKSNTGSGDRFSSRLFAFAIGCRGFYDANVWFFLHDFDTGASKKKRAGLAAWLERCCLGLLPAGEEQQPSDRTTPLLAAGVTPRQTKRDNILTSDRASRVSFAAVLLDLDNPDDEEDNNETDDNEEAGFLTGTDDLDLTPQLNVALRREVLHFVTTGIRESVMRWSARDDPASPPPERSTSAASASASVQSSVLAASVSSGEGSRRRVDSGFGPSLVGRALGLLGVPRGPGEYGSDPQCAGNAAQRGGRQESAASSTPLSYFWRHTEFSASTPAPPSAHGQFNQHQQNQNQYQQQQAQQQQQAPQEVVFDLDDTHRFRDWRPGTFALLRALDGLSNQRYLDLMSQSAREKLSSEGGSGAFQFFCGLGEVIVKTVSAGEKATLLRIIDQYLDHLKKNPSSHLVRFYGLHSLTLFNKEFSFVVMRNAFPPSASINERFDIKGSWVGRNASVVVPGSKQTCRMCGDVFVAGAFSSSCPVGVQGHEANTVLKDNDLMQKIRLRSDDCFNVIETLTRDSDALCAMGITDFSLLIGVKNHFYEVDSHSSSSASFPFAAEAAGEREVAPRLSFSASLRGSSNVPETGDEETGEGEGEGEGEEGERASVLSTAETVNIHIGPRRHRPNAADQFDDSRQDSARLRSLDLDLEGLGLRGQSRDSDLVGLGSSVLRETISARAARDQGFPARAVVAPSHYYVAIVDVLQDWSLSKRLEQLVRVWLLGQPAEGISCAPPDVYAARFQSKIGSVFDHSSFVREVTGGWSGQRVVSASRALDGTGNR